MLRKQTLFAQSESVKKPPADKSAIDEPAPLPSPLLGFAGQLDVLVAFVCVLSSFSELVQEKRQD